MCALRGLGVVVGCCKRAGRCLVVPAGQECSLAVSVCRAISSGFGGSVRFCLGFVDGLENRSFV